MGSPSSRKVCSYSLRFLTLGILLTTAMPPPIRVEIVPYSTTWPEFARQEMDRILCTLFDAIFEIHHIGSTSVPGLAAKPVIDLMAIVDDVAEIDGAWPKWAPLQRPAGFLLA